MTKNYGHLTNCQNINCNKEFIVGIGSTGKYCSKSCSAIIKNNIHVQKIKDEYNLNPKKCLQCENIIIFEKRKYDCCQKICTLEYNKKINEEQKNFITPIIKSKITGKFYNKEIHKNTWNNTAKLISAKRLAYMFNFELEQPDTEQNLINAVQTISNLYHIDNLSPTEIAIKFNLQYDEFANWMKKCLGIKLKNIQEAVINYCDKNNRSITDEKRIYYKKCKFKFNPYEYKNIPGYELLLEKGIYHAIKNPNGVTRDHMISRDFGYKNNIDPELISHPANCQFMGHLDNICKNSDCSISLEELKNRIESDIYVLHTHIDYKIYKSKRSDEQRLKISETMKKYCTITNGIINKRILKTDIIPEGFYRGRTIKHKKC